MEPASHSLWSQCLEEMDADGGRQPGGYSRAQRNITFSEHAASSTSINATCSRSPANLRIGLMI